MALTPAYERHTLLHIDLPGRERIFTEIAEKGYDAKAVGEMLLPERFPNEEGIASAIPGIARREEFSPRDGFIPVGFASWRSSENGRLRIGSFAAPAEIVTAVTPEEVAAKMAVRSESFVARTPALAALGSLRGQWGDRPLRLGVWGSAAMEIETGHAYTHRWSDLDVRLLPGGPVVKDELDLCLGMILEAETIHGIRIDAELRVTGEYGISLKELLGNGVTVLGKGRTDVALLQKTEVFAGLAG